MEGGHRGTAAAHLQQAVSAAPQPRGRRLRDHGLRLFRGTLYKARIHTHRCEPHVNIHRQPDPDFYVPMGFILFACRTYVCHTVYTRLEHRLAHSVKNIKSLLELLACCYETAHVALIAQIPECSADTLVRQSGPDVHRRIRL